MIESSSPDSSKPIEDLPPNGELESTSPSPPRQSSESGRAIASASPRQQLRRRGWGLKTKATTWALVLSTIPALVVGTVTTMSNQSIQKQLDRAGLIRHLHK